MKYPFKSSEYILYEEREFGFDSGFFDESSKVVYIYQEGRGTMLQA